MKVDNYTITNETIKKPPSTFLQKIKLLGPGFILSASIVGSGELIATTSLGAQAGFIAFWVIIASCFMKVAVQLEFGKHTILSGETAMHAFNKLPGPVFGKGKWTVWTIFGLMILKFVQVGGMMGGTAIVLNMLFPGISIFFWVFVIALLASTLIFKGYYAVVEKASLVMIVMFTIMTVTSLVFLKFTIYSFSWSDIAGGLQFKLPVEIVGVAIAAFGLTGVASDEIIAYSYWCIEKGYAAFTGPQRDTKEWRQRAQGWINVMYLDATVAMIVYTTVTASFYLLGASILHHRGIVPEGSQLIETVAFIYTESLGPGVRTMYLIGAFFVLFSSIFATLASWTRLFPDIFSQFGWIDFFDLTKRRKLIAILSWCFPLAWAFMYLFIELPVIMILSGGLIGSLLLFVVIYAVLHFRYGKIQIIKSSVLYDLAFWISILSIFGVSIYGVVKFFL